ncbi:hypothetical protein ACIG56_00505 [Nocardia fusca]|uniref:hypothetical protein n=1 Tax=Nocardia fusca TaxID=941183 RepID=UPI0037C60604
MQGDDIEDEASEGSDRGRVLDARAARGVQIGDHNTQVISIGAQSRPPSKA